jgi:uncharacterized protein (DUF1501 family)
MRRRDFLRSALFASALYGVSTAPRVVNVARADTFPALGRRLLVNVELDGAPDLRHLFPPAFDSDTSSFGYRYWEAMAGAHGIGNSGAEYESRWIDAYAPLGFGDTSFGILGGCGWLQRMWDRGKVAIVCNVLGASSRNHSHGLVVLQHGDRALGPNDSDGSGWGGRLAAAAGGRTLALTALPSPFCFGPDTHDPHGHDNSNMITAQDTRALTLFRPEDAANDNERRISRSLKSYYAAQRVEMPESSIYRRFVDAERTLRELGEPIDERLASVPVPAELAALYDGDGPALFTPDFGLQVRNLYDALLCSDILQPGVVSLAYSGFDTHKAQRVDLEPRLVDMFGNGMAFDTLFGLVPQSILDDIVLVFSGEFGRQIRANGDGGTDHGEGNTVLIVGESVRGGVYGDMFPEAELDRLGDTSPQIIGQTAIEPLFGAVCDWVEPGSGDAVFPGRAAAPVEPGLTLGSLFA